MGKEHHNYVLMVLLVSFVLVSVFGFDFILQNIVTEDFGSITGDAERLFGTVQLTIEESNVTAPSPKIGGKGSGRRWDLDKLRIEYAGKTLREALRVEVVVDELEVAQLKVINNNPVTLTIRMEDDLEIVTLDKEEVILRAQQSIPLHLSILALEVDVYTGVLSFITNVGSEYLPIIIIAKEKHPPSLDLSVTVPQAFKKVGEGTEVVGKVVVRDVGKDRLPVRYVIKDFYNAILYEEKEVIAFDGDQSFEKTIQLPASAPLGLYAFVVEVEKGEETVVATDTFEVVSLIKKKLETPEKQEESIGVILLLLVLLVLLMSVFLRQKKHKRNIE